MAAYRRVYDLSYVIFRLTAKNRDHLRNPTLGNRVGLWATFTFFTERSGKTALSVLSFAFDGKGVDNADTSVKRLTNFESKFTAF